VAPADGELISPTKAYLPPRRQERQGKPEPIDQCVVTSFAFLGVLGVLAAKTSFSVIE